MEFYEVKLKQLKLKVVDKTQFFFKNYRQVVNFCDTLISMNLYYFK